MAIRLQKLSEEAERQDMPLRRKQGPVSVATVRYLIEAGEEARLIPDEHGNTPLHMAIAVGSNSEIMRHLIETCTPAVATHTDCAKTREKPHGSVFLMPNKDRCTPLHLAMKNPWYTVPPTDIMRPCPQAMLAKDNNGCTPMHLLMSAFFPHIKLEDAIQLVQMQPEVLLAQDNAGCTPLHTLLKNISENKQREMEPVWQQRIIRLLTGVAPGLLTQDQTKQLMGLVDSANLTPLQFYMQKFRKRDGFCHFEVAGRELQHAQACP